MPESPPAAEPLLVLIDADCVLCTRIGQYLTRHAPPGRFLLIPLRSDQGQSLIAQYAIPNQDSFILIDAGHARIKSNAVFRTTRELPAPARWILILKILPQTWTDALYNLIAANRHRIFKQPATCDLPTASRD